MGWVIVDVCGEQDRPVWLSRDGIEWRPVPFDGLVGEDEWFAGTIRVGADRIVIDSASWGEALGWVGTLLGESPAETLNALPIVEVRLEGGAFFERASTEDDIRRGLGLVSAPETVADGRFLVQGQQWDEGPVWWESGAINEGWGDQQPRWIELDLGGNVTIEGAVVQADVNDEYLLSYRDPTTGEWELLWHIPYGSWGGMDTPTNPTDNTEPMIFPEPVTTDLLRFEAWSGDGMYSVSEIQVFAPEGTVTVTVAGVEDLGGSAGTVAVQPPEGTVTVTPVQWGINPDDPDWNPGIHTVLMIVEVRPLTVGVVEDVSGRLIWDETVVDLCGIDIRREGDGFLHIGDIFQTSEGCGNHPTAMQDAFDESGLPETACVTVRFGGVDHEYCSPLTRPRRWRPVGSIRRCVWWCRFRTLSDHDAMSASTPTTRSPRSISTLVLEAGRRTPSANNRQWWDFVVRIYCRQLSELTGVWQRGEAPRRGGSRGSGDRRGHR